MGRQHQATNPYFDPLYKVVSGRLNDDFDMRQFADRMDDFIDRHKVALILVHHEGKDMIIDGERFDRGADASFGSSVMGWWVDTAIELRAKADNSNIVDIRFPLVRLSQDDIKPFRLEFVRKNLTIKRLPIDGGSALHNDFT